MKFANPLVLMLFLPLLFVAWRLLRYGRRGGIRFAAIGFLPRNSSGWRGKLAKFTPFILLAALTLLIIAAARPRTSLSREQREKNAIAIAMTVDVSGTMEALDLTPKGAKFSKDTTRLAVVKKLFAEFVEKRPDDLIALVTFGGYAATRVPLTADHDALLGVLRTVEVPPTPYDANGRQIGEGEQMTAIGDGLSVALLRLKDAKPKSKVVILLSDGMNNAGAVDPDEAAKHAASLGIKIYTIGVGTKSVRTPFFGRDFFGRTTIVYNDTNFDEKQLRSIAEKTGGMYFSVNDRDSLKKALEEIDKLEKTKIEEDVWDRWEEHFIAFLLAGVALALLATSLSVVSFRRLA